MLSRNRSCLKLSAMLGAAALAAFVVPAPARAEPWAYNVQFGDLVRADLATGEIEVVGPTGVAGLQSASLAEDSAGNFFLLGYQDSAPPGQYSLYRIDAASGAATPVVALSGSPEDGLEMGTDGLLYVAAGERLFQYDPDTGEQIDLIPLSLGSFKSLARSGNALYGVVEVAGLTCRLVLLDPAGHTGTVVLPNAPCATSMAADARGRLWMVSDAPFVVGGVFSVRVDVFEPATQEVTRWAEWGGFLGVPEPTSFRGLAGVGPLGPVDVPSAGKSGLALLALALAGAGAIFLRRS